MPENLLIFGENGQVATELARRLPAATFMGRAACDLTMRGNAKAAIDQRNPKAVINASAYTAVDDAEDNFSDALALNSDAPEEMAKACAGLGIPLLHISTDYVFDGTGTSPWRETDPIAPINAYGRSKAIGEARIAESGCTHLILRTSWVFSAHGGNFVRTMLRLANDRDRLNIVADQIGGPTWAGHIADALVRATQEIMNDPGKSGIFHYSGAPSVSWADFAQEIFGQAKKSLTVQKIGSDEFPTKAKRPKNSRLDCQKIDDVFGIPAPDWRAGLRETLHELLSNDGGH